MADMRCDLKASARCRLKAAQAAMDARNARYRSGAGLISGSAMGRSMSEDEDVPERVVGRLGQAERAVEKFVARRLKAVQPAVDKVQSRLHRMHLVAPWQSASPG